MSTADLSRAIRQAESLEASLERLLAEYPYDTVIHFAYTHCRITVLHLRHLFAKQNKESL